MYLIEETVTWVTTLNPTNALMASFDLTRGTVHKQYEPTFQGHNHFPNVIVYILNDATGATFTIQFGMDNRDGDFATYAAKNQVYMKLGTDSDLVVSKTIATTVGEWLQPSLEQAAGAQGGHILPFEVLNIYGSATVAAAAGNGIKMIAYLSSY